MIWPNSPNPRKLRGVYKRTGHGRKGDIKEELPVRLGVRRRLGEQQRGAHPVAAEPVEREAASRQDWLNGGVSGNGDTLNMICATRSLFALGSSGASMSNNGCSSWCNRKS